MDTVQTPLAAAGVTIRPAGIEDLDALLGLESRCFDSDRLSRRSFRRFLQGESDHLLVAEDALGALGYILLLRRRGTRLARIYSICVDPEARGRQIAQGLMLAGESAVLAAGSAWVRLEVRRDNVGAIRLYERLGYRRFGEMPDYYEDGEEALRFEKRIRFHAVDRADVAVPYYSQTTPFTCGPASLMMAMSALRPGTPMDQREELRLWREATTIYMSSGHGGCGPQGLALAAWRRGFGVELFLNDDRVLFLDSVRDEHKKQILAVVHEDYCSQVADADIPTQYQPLGVPAIEQALAERRVPVVLISSWRLTREKAPHWVVVSAIDEDFVYIHDPEIKPERSEDRTDKQDVPIDRAAFARMARFGQSGMRAALLLSRARPSPRRKS
jgi:ribosomal protein S18 acetylase RimI-like enzyme